MIGVKRRGRSPAGAANGASRRQPPLAAGYQHFRLERQGALVSTRTLEYFDGMVLPFLRWLEGEGVRRFGDLDAGPVRTYRAQLAARPGQHGRPLQPKTILESHRAILAFLRWARREGYEVDERILDLTAPRVPLKEPTVYHIAQLRKILDACNPSVPTEALVVRLLVGSGMRRAEICGLATVGPDGLPDLMTDSLRRGRVELRVRWDAGAKGRRSRRVPITPKLATIVKRYEARQRPETEYPNLLINEHGQPYEGRRDQAHDGPPPGADGVPRSRPRLPAHVRDGGHQAGLELRAPAGGHGPLGVRKAAWCFYDEGHPDAERWVRGRLRAVLKGQAASVAPGLRRKAAREHRDRAARATIDECAAYLVRKRPYLDYPTALIRGWPIATGVIEGACRHLVNDRRTSPAPAGAPTAPMKMRAIVSNHDVEEYWRYHLAHEHERVHRSRYARPRQLALVA